MPRSRMQIVLLAAWSILLLEWPAGAREDKPDKSKDRNPVQLGKDARVSPTPGLMAQLPAGQAARKFDVKVTPGKPKGIADKVYPTVAPGVVIVRTPVSHGTGFLIDPDGWVVTNHHVVARAFPDVKTGALTVDVFLGEMDKEGQVRPMKKSVPGVVYRVDRRRDLALVKLTRLPAGVKKFPYLRISDDPIKPGSDCVAIGHPAALNCWAVRLGVVSGIANWPKDRTDFVIGLLGVDKASRTETMKRLAGLESHKALLSSCLLNPGDSGGPLVNGKSEVIGVSFAIPSDKDLAKTAYHVHRDELKDFLGDLKKLPKGAPEPFVPDLEPMAMMIRLVALDADALPNLLIFGIFDQQKGKLVSGLWLDLKQKNTARTAADVDTSKKRKDWQFQFALHLQPYPIAFYDSGDTGKIDVILFDTDGDGKADVGIRLQKGKWVVDPQLVGKSLIEPSLFTDKKLAGAFRGKAPLLVQSIFRRGRE